MKAQVVYFCDDHEMADLVSLTLSDQFQVTTVTGVTHLNDAVNALRRIKPEYVIIDPNLPTLNHQQLNRRIKADEDLKGIQILLIWEDH
jgi:DNA-binding response OmpR family regulator